MEYVTGLARKVKADSVITAEVKIGSPDSRNATDFVSNLFLFFFISNFEINKY